MMNTNVICFTFVLIFSHAHCDVFNAADIARIENIIGELRRCKQIPAVVVSAVKEGETWTKAYGMADNVQNIPATEDTLFAIGSESKAFTTALLAMLLSDNKEKYNWNSKVKDLMGSPIEFSDSYRTHHMMLKDLVSHRTGLATAFFTLLAGFDTNFTRADLASRLKYLPEAREFRDSFEYNNLGFCLSAHIIEKLTGDTYENVLKRRIFDPLGMTNSGVMGKTIFVDDPRMARPYSMEGNTLRETDKSIYIINPCESSAGIVSTANDMTKWLQFLLSMGKDSNDNQLVDPAIFGQVFQTHISVSTRGGNFRPQFPFTDIGYGYGYGWFQRVYNGYRQVVHGGRLNSYRNVIQLFPDVNAGLAISINGPEGSGNSPLAYFIGDILLGEEPWINTSTACTYPQPFQPPRPPMPVRPPITNEDVDCVECFTGKYGHPFFYNLEVKASPGGRSLELYFNRILGSLNSTNERNVFQLDLWDPYGLDFNSGSDQRMLSRVEFSNLEHEQYKRISITFGIGGSVWFDRGTDFYNPEEKMMTSKPTSGQGIVSTFATLFCTISVLSIKAVDRIL